MRFRKKKQPESKTDSADVLDKNAPLPIQAHKYHLHFDILPEISYLNEHLCVLIADFLPLFRGYPENTWLSKKGVDEGLDFCRIHFWAFALNPDAIKEFSIWFQAIFREEAVSEVLERFVQNALEKPHDAEVMLTDWSRVHVPEAEVWEVIKQEMS